MNDEEYDISDEDDHPRNRGPFLSSGVADIRSMLRQPFEGSFVEYDDEKGFGGKSVASKSCKEQISRSMELPRRKVHRRTSSYTQSFRNVFVTQMNRL